MNATYQLAGGRLPSTDENPERSPVDSSKDGQTWQTVANHLEPRVWGRNIVLNGLLPDDACGGTTLWLRVRLLAEGPWKRTDYCLAQFLRDRPVGTANRFELEVECEPAGDAAVAGGRSTEGPAPLSD